MPSTGGASLKPANRSPDWTAFTSPAARPIPGRACPMVLMSGWIAADALDRDADLGTNRRRSA